METKQMETKDESERGAKDLEEEELIDELQACTSILVKKMKGKKR